MARRHAVAHDRLLTRKRSVLANLGVPQIAWHAIRKCYAREEEIED
jgi:hypothetical protein